MKPFTAFHIVLVEPEIPPNTGNIARLCGATCSVLHLVGKLGFSTDDRALKRAGLDYWKEVDIKYWSSLDELREAYPLGRFFYTSKKGKKTFTVSLKQASESTPDVSKMAQALGLSEEEVRAMIRRQRENLHKMTLEAQEVEESDIEATEPEPEPEPVQPVKMPRRAAKV